MIYSGRIIILMKRNNLDERQEQILLKIEHNACYIAFWGLLVVFVAEALIFDYDIKMIAGEWLIFMILSIYLFIACMKNGIWDRRLKPDFKTNLIISVIAAVISGILMAVSVGLRFPDKPAGSIASGIMTAVFVFVPCIILLSISSNKVKKIAARQEAEEENE